MESVGLRELRQDASELIRRVEQGEEIEITVSGRPAARLVPVGPRQWNDWATVSDLFVGPAEERWEADQALIDGSVDDPWTRHR
jgi:prevent-host-death family protein